MVIDLLKLQVPDLKDTLDDPVVLFVPADEERTVLLNCNPQHVPVHIPLEVHKQGPALSVIRQDQEPIQVRDAQPMEGEWHIRPYIFRQPVDSVDFRFNAYPPVWQYVDSENIANRSLLDKFAFLIGNFAVSRQTLRRHN